MESIPTADIARAPILASSMKPNARHLAEEASNAKAPILASSTEPNARHLAEDEHQASLDRDYMIALF